MRQLVKQHQTGVYGVLTGLDGYVVGGRVIHPSAALVAGSLSFVGAAPLPVAPSPDESWLSLAV